MTQTKTDTTVRISGSDYILEVSADKIAVYLAGEHICSLDPRSALNTAGDGDATNIDGESEILSFTETGFTPSRAHLYLDFKKLKLGEQNLYSHLP